MIRTLVTKAGAGVAVGLDFKETWEIFWSDEITLSFGLGGGHMTVETHQTLHFKSVVLVYVNYISKINLSFKKQ